MKETNIFLILGFGCGHILTTEVSNLEFNFLFQVILDMFSLVAASRSIRLLLGKKDKKYSNKIILMDILARFYGCTNPGKNI